MLDFLRHHEADTILPRRRHHRRLAPHQSGWYWPQSHNDIIQKLLRKVRKGAQDDLRAGQPRRVRPQLCRDDIRRRRGHAGYDPCHGRRRPAATSSPTETSSTSWCGMPAGWRLLGDWAYETALVTNTYFNLVRRKARASLIGLFRPGPSSEGEERRQLHRRLRGGAVAGGHSSQGRWRGMWPHPPRGHPCR